jgi:hypothetical protein
VSPILPKHPVWAAAVAAVVLSTIVAGCGLLPLSVAGLLVATGGPLQVTDGSGGLAAFDGPAEPVVAVTSSDGRVVAATVDGRLITSSGSGGTRTWEDVDVPADARLRFPLIAVSPLGQKLAMAVGEPQGASFDLLLVDVGLGTMRSISVGRGLNGPPAWIGPGIVALDVIKPNGESAVATIDIGSGAVTDDALPGHVVSASIDGKRLALDDPATGDVLVGETVSAGVGPLGDVVSLRGPAGSGVESLAMSPAGGHLAVVRRADGGSALVELYRAVDGGWSKARTIELAGDGAVSVAWLQ